MSEPDGADAGTEEEVEEEEEEEDVEEVEEEVEEGSPAGTGSGVGEHPDIDVEGEKRDAFDRLEEIAEEPEGDADRRLRELAAEAVHPPADVAPDGREAAFEPAELELEDEFVDRVAEADPETVAGEIATLQLRIAALEGETAELESEVEDLESRLARKQADFQNYKKRQQRRLEEEKQRATEDLVERLLDVRDNLHRALEQDEDADIRGGVESTLRQFDEEFEREDVSVIEPVPGEATDPQHHEVLMRVESDQPADTVAQVHRPGYEMAGKVLRPAQVTVSEGSSGTEDGPTAGAAGDEADPGTDEVDATGEERDATAGEQ